MAGMYRAKDKKRVSAKKDDKDKKAPMSKTTYKKK